MTFQEERKKLARKLCEAIKRGDGFSPPEADSRLNDANRTLIKAYIDNFGSAWVGLINRYSTDADKPYLWEVKNPDTVKNFAAAFVLPAYEEGLVDLIKQWQATPTTAIITQIYDVIEEVGGSALVWS